MGRPHIPRALFSASLALAVCFAVLWAHTYWFDAFLGYDTRTTMAKGSHKFWVSTQPGAFDIALQWESFNPNQQRSRGEWSFYDNKRQPSFCAVVGGPEAPASFIGFQHWVVETADLYCYNYTWIPFWFPTLLFASPAVWYFGSKKLALNPALQATAAPQRG